jgi:hypothetical protein
MYRGKRLGIMQPYFFPYLGYFGLIVHTDRWIVFDSVQYIRKGWMNRNRILKAGGGEKYIGVTVADHSRETLIRDMRLAPEPDRFDRIRRHLDAYKLLRAPRYKAVLDLLRDCLETQTDDLVALLVRCLSRTCSYIGIPFLYEVSSAMALTHPEPVLPMDWSLYMCAALGAAEYVNPPGGRTLFDAQRFAANGLKLLYYEQEFPSYDQGGGAFIPGLSIIDVMMFNTPERILEMLAQHRLCEP